MNGDRPEKIGTDIMNNDRDPSPEKKNGLENKATTATLRVILLGL